MLYIVKTAPLKILGETLLSRNSSKSRSKMTLPSKSKRGFDEACDRRVGWGNLFILSSSCFSPFRPVLVSVQTSCRPKTGTFAPGARCGSDEFRLVIGIASGQISLRTPNKRIRNLCLVFICQTGHLGALGRTANFQVVANRSQQYHRTFPLGI
jgi:hypothetical protein